MPRNYLTGNAGLFLHRRKAELLDPLRKVSDLLVPDVGHYNQLINLYCSGPYVRRSP
jgi:hypothetical protein